MKTKKLLSLVLCVVMVFAVTVPGLAVETDQVDASAVALNVHIASVTCMMTNSANLRASPSTSASIIGHANMYDVVEVYEFAYQEDIVWVYVEVTGGITSGSSWSSGWCSADIVSGW